MREMLFIGSATIVLSLAAVLIASCGNDTDDDDDNGPDCPTYDAIEVGAISQTPGTVECDLECDNRSDGWDRKCIKDFADCYDSCDTADCADACDTCGAECLQVTGQALNECAGFCDSCLKDYLVCDDECGDGTACQQDCTQTLYACHDWDFECWKSCKDDYDFCWDLAEDGADLVDCYDEANACLKGCRQ